MSFGRNLQAERGSLRGGHGSTFDGNNDNNGNRKRSRNYNYHRNYNIHNNYWAEHGGNSNFYSIGRANNVKYEVVPSSLKRRKYSPLNREDNWKHHLPFTVQDKIPSSINFQAPLTSSNVDTSVSPICKLDCSIDDESVFMSRDEIDRCSPSRKDGIDVLQETHLRYSYCAFLQNLGIRLVLPQTTIGTAMVLCHSFFFDNHMLAMTDLRVSNCPQTPIDCHCCSLSCWKVRGNTMPFD